MTENGQDGRKHWQPTAQQLQIVIEQPGEADEATLEYLKSHPAVRRVFQRQRNLKLLAEQIGKECSDFDWNEFARRVEERYRELGGGRSV